MSCLALNAEHVQNKIFTFGLIVDQGGEEKKSTWPPEGF